MAIYTALLLTAHSQHICNYLPTLIFKNQDFGFKLLLLCQC